MRNEPSLALPMGTVHAEHELENSMRCSHGGFEHLDSGVGGMAVKDGDIHAACHPLGYWRLGRRRRRRG